jgi:hypothetical protein
MTCVTVPGVGKTEFRLETDRSIVDLAGTATSRP